MKAWWNHRAFFVTNQTYEKLKICVAFANIVFSLLSF